MNQVAKTPFYELSYDTGKNRIYLKIMGFWRNPEAVPNYLSDFAKILKLTRRNFTLLADVTQMPVHPKEVQKVHEAAQQLIKNAGVARIAHLLAENIFAEFIIDTISNINQMPQDKFQNLPEAEAWLDKA